MTVILKSIRLVGSKDSEEVKAVFDSGATYSCIQPKLAQRLGAPEALPEPMDFNTAEEGRTVQAEQAVRLNFYLDDHRFSDEFMLIPGLSEAATRASPSTAIPRATSFCAPPQLSTQRGLSSPQSPLGAG